LIPALLKAGKKPCPQLWQSNRIFFEVFYALDAFRQIDGTSGMMGPFDPRLIDWWIEKNRRRLTPRLLVEIPLFVPRMDVAWRSAKNKRTARSNGSSGGRTAREQADDDEE
jgi:hypothetical protein